MVSYPYALYWSISTLTSTGYGDIHAISCAEQWFATFTMIAGEWNGRPDAQAGGDAGFSQQQTPLMLVDGTFPPTPSPATLRIHFWPGRFTFNQHGLCANGARGKHHQSVASHDRNENRAGDACASAELPTDPVVTSHNIVEQ